MTAFLSGHAPSPKCGMRRFSHSEATAVPVAKRRFHEPTEQAICHSGVDNGGLDRLNPRAGSPETVG
jgi:hypothetical protein